MKIVGVGPHYASLLHSRQLELQNPLFLFTKPSTTIVQSGQNIVRPSQADQTIAEVEIAIRLKSSAKNITREQAKSRGLIEAYTIAFDMTAVGGKVFGDGKIYDTFTPLGEFKPYSDDKNITIQSRCNGQLMQSGSTQEMTYSFYELLAYCSEHFTLEAGDIILTGTPAGPFEVHAGDRIEMSSPDFGTYDFEVK